MKIIRKIKYNSPVVLTFALISLVVFLLGEATDNWTTIRFFCVYRSSLKDPLTYARMFGYVLGHGSFEHYMGNIILMLVIGPSLEERYGRGNLLRAILVTAFIGGVVQWLFFPGTALLGASGILFMMIVMSSITGSTDGSIPLTLILVLVLYVGREVVNGLFTEDNISQITHIIGGICGAFAGMKLSRNKKK